MWDARLLGLLPKFTQHHHFIFGLVGVREGNLRPPQSNGCWQLLQYLMTLMRSRRHRQLWCSTSFKTIAKMREKGNSKHVIEYNCDTISKIAVWATFSAKVWVFPFLSDHLHTVVKDQFLFKNSILSNEFEFFMSKNLPF